jgi:tripartite-type tricarboxylate transporter receptor subunit TctC
MIRRRTLLVVSSASFASPARAALPTGPIRVVVPFAPGGAIDAIGRALARRMGETTGRSFVVENRAGAGGTIGAAAVARAAPGRLTYASGGAGNASHLFMADFLRRAGLEMTHVPCRGGGDIIRALLSGETGFSVTTIATALPLVRSGGLRALGVGEAAPHPLLPDVPPLSAAVAGFTASAWHGLHAPAATPRPILGVLHAAAAEAVADPALRAWMSERGITPRGGTAEEAAAFIAAETARWTDVAREAGVRPD